MQSDREYRRRWKQFFDCSPDFWGASVTLVVVVSLWVLVIVLL